MMVGMSMSERLAVGVAAVFAGLSAAAFFTILPPAWFWDVYWYAEALPALTSDAPLYPPEWLEDHVTGYVPHYNLPPATALFAPLAALGRLPWGLLMLGCLVAALVLMWPRLRPAHSLLLAAALIAWWPLLEAAAWANINSLVLLLLAVAWRWPRHAGVALGAAAAFKAAPILLLSILIGRREWRQLALALATGAGLTLLAAAFAGPESLWHFVILQLHETQPDHWWRLSASEFMPQWAAWLLALALAAAACIRGSWGFAVAAVLVAVPTLHMLYWIWLLVPALGTLATSPRGHGYSARVERHGPPDRDRRGGEDELRAGARHAARAVEDSLAGAIRDTHPPSGASRRASSGERDA